jgi:hypothetical protein
MCKQSRLIGPGFGLSLKGLLSYKTDKLKVISDLKCLKL